jgi:CTD kinase subunit beta
MHDTLKKPKELLAVAYGIRNPELAARSKHPSGEIDLDTLDPAVRLHVICLLENKIETM